MESAKWSFIVPLYPVQFAQVGKSILKFLQSHLNKFIPELNGLLIEFDKSTLQIRTSEQTNWTQLCPQLYGVFLIRPELSYLRIRAQINVRVFVPKVGQELDAKVFSVKPHMVLCNTEIAQITVSLPRQQNTNLFSDEGTQKPEPDELKKLKPNDQVKVRLTQVMLNPTMFIIRGELVSVLENTIKAVDGILKRFKDDSSSEGSDNGNDDVELSHCESSGLESNLKPENQSPCLQRPIKPENNDDILWTPEPESISVRKSGKSKPSDDPGNSPSDFIQPSSDEPKKRKYIVQFQDIILKKESY